MNVDKTLDAGKNMAAMASGLSATELMLIMIVIILLIVGFVIFLWSKAYCKIRFENSVRRRIGYDAFKRGLLGVGDKTRLPTATGSETARITDLSFEHIEIQYANGDMGHIPFAGFESIPLRKVTDGEWALEEAGNERYGKLLTELVTIRKELTE